MFTVGGFLTSFLCISKLYPWHIYVLRNVKLLGQVLITIIAHSFILRFKVYNGSNCIGFIDNFINYLYFCINYVTKVCWSNNVILFLAFNW